MTICGTRFGPYNSPSQPMLILYVAKLNADQTENPKCVFRQKNCFHYEWILNWWII